MQLWKRLQAALIRLGIAGIIIAFIGGIIAAAYFAAVFPDWTGFAADPIPPQTAVTPIVVYQPAKTLWDWLQLLLVPLVIAVGGYWITRSENRYALQLQERREAEARKLEMERAQDAALQAYFDQMTDLLLHENLRISKPGSGGVRSVARARTLTILQTLDDARKMTVLQFLFEAGLLGGMGQADDGEFVRIEAVISLLGARLRGAHLETAYLWGVHLETADLREAHLNGAVLTEANLNSAHLEGAHLEAAYLAKAHLSWAHLEGANLKGANLEGAELTSAHLEEANLEGAQLEGAHLKRAILSGARLERADLRRVDLTDCIVTREQLAQAASLEGAKLPFDMASPAPEVDVVAQTDQAKKQTAAVEPTKK